LSLLYTPSRQAYATLNCRNNKQHNFSGDFGKNRKIISRELFLSNEHTKKFSGIKQLGKFIL